MDVVVVRDGKNLRGKLLAGVLSAFGSRVLGGQLKKSIEAIEARSHGTGEAGTPPAEG